MRDLTKEETEAIAQVMSRFVWDSEENEGEILAKLADGAQRNRVSHELKWLRGFAAEFARSQSKVGEPELEAIYQTYHDHWKEWGEANDEQRVWVSNFTAVVSAYSEAATRTSHDGIPLAIGKAFAELCGKDDETGLDERETELTMFGAIEFAATVKQVLECLEDAIEALQKT